MAGRSTPGTASRRKRRGSVTSKRSRGARSYRPAPTGKTVQAASHGHTVAPAGIDIDGLANSLGTGLAGELGPVLQLLVDQKKAAERQLEEERQSRLALQFELRTARRQLERDLDELRGEVRAR